MEELNYGNVYECDWIRDGEVKALYIGRIPYVGIIHRTSTKMRRHVILIREDKNRILCYGLGIENYILKDNKLYLMGFKRMRLNKFEEKYSDLILKKRNL